MKICLDLVIIIKLVLGIGFILGASVFMVLYSLIEIINKYFKKK